MIVLPDQEIVAAYEAGATLDDLAAEYGVSRQPIRRVLRNAGVDLRPHGPRWPYDPSTEKRMASGYEAGQTIEQLEERHGGTNRTVRKALTKQGVTIRSVGRPAT